MIDRFAVYVSNLSLQNPNDFGTLVRGLNVYGTSVVQPNGLALLVAAG
jgi:hypothetical protein